MGFAFRMQGSRAKRGPTPGLSAPFNDVTGQALNTVITSNTVQVLNIAGGSAITITGGAALGIGNGTSVEYSINGGAFTASAGTIDPTDQLALRITTHAAYLGDQSQVKVTVAGIGNVLWNVTSIAPAPAMTGVHMIFGLGTQYASTRGGTPSITTVATSYNTGTASTTLSDASMAHPDKNYAVTAGSTNTYPWTPFPAAAGGGGLVIMFKGVLNNAMYKTDKYAFGITCTLHATGLPGNIDAQVGWFDEYDGTLFAGTGGDPALYSIGDGSMLDWIRSGITTNSQTVSLFPGYDPSTGTDNFGPSVQSHNNSARYQLFHLGHPAPTTPGSAG